MRYALISDVHSNIQALDAVLTDILSNDVDEIICLGDVVGYGPCPAEVLQTVYSRVHHFVLGNHDAVVCGKLDPGCFNENAQKLISWTRTRLDRKAARFLAGLPLVLEGDDFCCVHAEFSAPMRFGYIIDEDEALRAWQAREEKLLFVGHTHLPGLFVIGDSGTPHAVEAQDFSLEPNKRYIVNPGSVGQPRDQDLRASYCIYDTDTASVFYRRVPFDIAAYRAAVAEAGLEESSSYFLQVADSKALPPLREILDFSPSADMADAPASSDEVKRLDEVTKSARRWRFIGILLFVLLLVAGTTLAVVMKRMPAETIINAGEAGQTLDAPGPDAVSVLPPEPVGVVGEENLLAQWSLRLGEPELVSVTAETRLDETRQREEPVFRVSSSALSSFALRSLPFNAGAGERYRVKAAFLNVALDAGFVEIVLVGKGADGTERVLCRAEPSRLKQKDYWCPASKTMDGNLQDATELYVVVRGEFKGEVLVRDCALEGRQPAD